jgi:hypothetical protein
MIAIPLQIFSFGFSGVASLLLRIRIGPIAPRSGTAKRVKVLIARLVAGYVRFLARFATGKASARQAFVR